MSRMVEMMVRGLQRPKTTVRDLQVSHSETGPPMHLLAIENEKRKRKQKWGTGWMVKALRGHQVRLYLLHSSPPTVKNQQGIGTNQKMSQLRVIEG